MCVSLCVRQAVKQTFFLTTVKMLKAKKYVLKQNISLDQIFGGFLESNSTSSIILIIFV